MFIYIASAVPAFDDTCKAGMTNNCYDRLSQFNCPSPRPWRGRFLRVYSDPEHWEGVLLDIFSEFRQEKHYGDSEVLYARLAVNCSDFIARREARKPERLALAQWAVDAMAEFCGWQIASQAMHHAIISNGCDRILDQQGFDSYSEVKRDLDGRTSHWMPQETYSEEIKYLVDNGFTPMMGQPVHAYGKRENSNG